MSEEYQKITIPEYVEYQKLKQENARLREALGFYADKENWNSSKYDDPIFFGEEIGGLRARKALEKSE